MQCFKNAKEIQNISLIDRAFHYGDGCFSTARIRDNHIELYSRHLQRLMECQQRLFLAADLTLIDQTIERLMVQEKELNGTLKIILSRGEGQRGYSLPKTAADVWVMYYPQSQPTKNSIEEIQGGVAEQRLGLVMPQLVGLKTLNRLEQVLLKKECDDKAWAEALVLDIHGNIVEGVSSNCFIRMNKQWFSPELRYNGIHGVMRAEILQRMQDASLQCVQRPIDQSEIVQIESLFFCNALSPMRIMSQLDHQHLDVQACLDLFHFLQLNQIH